MVIELRFIGFMLVMNKAILHERTVAVCASIDFGKGSCVFKCVYACIMLYFAVTRRNKRRMCVDTEDGSFVTATVAALDRSGWTTCCAEEQRQASRIVNTVDGGLTTVHIMKTSLSSATPVCLLHCTVLCTIGGDQRSKCN